MTAEKHIWQYEELEGRWDEVFRRAAAGEPQEIRDAAGRSIVMQLGQVTPNGLSVYDPDLRGDDFQPERLSGTLRDLDL